MVIRSGEWIIRTGTAGYAELYAYDLAQKHFNSVVPYTLPYIGASTVGSKQQIAGKTALSLATSIIPLTRTPQALEDLANIVGLDLVLGNQDRHSENWLVSDSGRIYAIDHESSVGHQTLRSALRPVYFSDLMDDSVYTLLFISELWSVLAKIVFHSLAPDTSIDEWETDLKQWYSDLQQNSPHLMTAVANAKTISL